MPKSEKLLFIGGPSDGQTFTTDQKKVTISVSVPYGKSNKKQSTQYIRETIKLGRAKMEVMRHKDLKKDKLLTILIDEYHYSKSFRGY